MVVSVLQPQLNYCFCVSMTMVVEAVFYGALVFMTFYLVNVHVPEPFMDEIFHIQQMRVWCESPLNISLASYDEKITTPPGLYLTTLAALQPIVLFVGNNYICHTWWFRAHNAITACILLLQLPSSTIRLNLSLFPVFFFFAFLYYTDVASLLFLLLAVRHHNFLPWHCLALLFRQTNIIWLLFFAGFRLVRRHEASKEKINILQYIAKRFLSIVVSELATVTSLMLFLLFLYANEGIVLGDRSAHVAVFHAPQFLYFLLFAFALSPSLFFYASIRNLSKSKLVYFLLSLVAIVCVYYKTYEHLYLLSDNRHYTFYIWRRIFKRNDWIKYALCVLYPAFFILLNRAMLKQHQPLTLLGFWLCTGVSLIPQKLLEFRYFIPPLFVMRVFLLPHPPHVPIIFRLELFFYLLVNCVTLYVFIYRPFLDSNGVLQRFMW